jgi:hypothetical protein
VARTGPIVIGYHGTSASQPATIEARAAFELDQAIYPSADNTSMKGRPSP